MRTVDQVLLQDIFDALIRIEALVQDQQDLVRRTQVESHRRKVEQEEARLRRGQPERKGQVN